MCDIMSCNQDSDLPPIEITDDQRRTFLKGMAALPIATVLFHPELASAQASMLDEVIIKNGMGKEVKATIAMPEKLPAPTVILIHEWWGLNDNIKAMAAEYAKHGFIALAVDLYDGGVGTKREEALALMKSVKQAEAEDTLKSWAEFLRNHKDSTGKVATLGWCFGGAWSLNASIVADVDATVIYYGRLGRSVEDLKKLKAPVLGHFGTLDKSIDAKMVGEFEARMDEAGKSDLLEVHWYTANHAFANPTGSRYDADDAELSLHRTLAFLHKNL
ncbi:dienelactone hydrolase family protein [Curvivirga sp.]|uniref:dienelactone hydrolase family protein n=1 Tax=Curvivirga sp. TaxID=2856848 RepID=UPI003B595850